MSEGLPPPLTPGGDAPETLDTRLAGVWSLLARGEVDAARGAMERLEREHPGRPALTLHRWLLHEQLGETDAAAHALGEGLASGQQLAPWLVHALHPSEQAAMWLEAGMRWSSLRRQHDREAAAKLMYARMAGALSAEDIATAGADLALELSGEEFQQDLAEREELAVVVEVAQQVLGARAPQLAVSLGGTPAADASRTPRGAVDDLRRQGEVEALLLDWIHCAPIGARYLRSLGRRLKAAHEADPARFEAALARLEDRSPALLDTLQTSLAEEVGQVIGIPDPDEDEAGTDEMLTGMARDKTALAGVAQSAGRSATGEFAKGTVWLLALLMGVLAFRLGWVGLLICALLFGFAVFTTRMITRGTYQRVRPLLAQMVRETGIGPQRALFLMTQTDADYGPLHALVPLMAEDRLLETLALLQRYDPER